MKTGDKIFTIIMVIFVIGIGYWLGGASGIIDAVIVFIQETFKVLICGFILVLLCVFFPKIRNLFDKSNKK